MEHLFPVDWVASLKNELEGVNSQTLGSNPRGLMHDCASVKAARAAIKRQAMMMEFMDWCVFLNKETVSCSSSSLLSFLFSFLKKKRKKKKKEKNLKILHTKTINQCNHKVQSISLFY